MPTLHTPGAINVTPTKITDTMDHNLIKPVSESEIFAMLKEMGPSKAPGIDSMTALFFQTYWTTIGADVVAAIKSFFHTSHLLRSTNLTLITLIPKVGCPVRSNQFKHISLYNVSYKIITKILANRLRPILPLIISKNQSGFVGG
ncbi:hypothetical protein Vadar_001285 [Vaccinium darrowii]|uniref:Uncharacterized protein n=1 Tax=Vaccinium darrowii TaxID=229202 RepID=A0ACB7XEY6_9ERIC|nr:hypothetical protein Vadar_001285 [Vaccinium darrowii]